MTNRIGIYYAYWEHDWLADLLPYPERVARLGFDVLEVKLSVILEMPERRRKELKRRAEENGIELTFCDALTEKTDISSPNPSIRNRGMEYLKQGLDVVHKLGGSILGGILYGPWNPSTEGALYKRDRLQWSVESMREVIKATENLGIICAIEAVNRFEQFLVNTCAEALDYIEMVGSPNLKVMLDTFHMNIEEDSVYEAILIAGRDLGHLHIGEANRKLPGQGRFPWPELVRALRTIGYSGRIVMEPFVQTGGEIGRDVRVWRDLSKGCNLDNEAEKSVCFIRALLAQTRS